MNKILLTTLFSLIISCSMFAQQHTGSKPPSSSEKAKKTVDRITDKVPFTTQQKANLIPIFTKFYDDVTAQRAYYDQTKLGPLEKARDAKVSKMLNNPKLYKQYSDVVIEMKAEFLMRHKQK
ncbi:MAG: hypothetical protein NTW10_02205 [Bacteroidetes bacterium]|nr:hypothetical protein [Bacteroidota bacterium]